MPSPICSVKDGAGAFVASTTKVSVTPGNVITIKLDDPAGAGTWELICTTADELSDASAITAGISINQLTKQATFTCPAFSGRSYIFRSRVQSGVGPLTTGGYGTRSDYETSFKIYTAAVGGLDVGAVGEEVEGGPAGMASSINSLIRSGGSASVPTGTGIPHIVAGVQSAASSLIVNADVDAAAAISVSKLAAGTNTYVLTTTAGVPVWAAPSGGGSVPTGTGFYTVTGGVMDAASKSAAAGIYTWLATPSSANLAAALTDETGTGEVVFSTTPTLKTSVKINNPANTFAYTLTPAAIAANRTLNLPLLTGTDTLVGEAHTATLTNKTIAAGSNTITGLTNANVDAAAAIAVSKLAAGTNTYVLTTTAGVPVWAAPASGGTPTGTGFYGVTAGAMDAAAIKVNLASATYVTGTLGVGNGGTGITSLGAGIATWLGTPSSANLATAVTDETGSGSLVFQTSPTFKTGILLNNPANTFAYTFTPAAIAAARTITLPLLTGNDTMVTEAFTQTLTNKTISGASNTITNVSLTTGVTGTLPVGNGGTGITSLGAGVATWLGTPSSANLATALTDETGTGEVVFSTTPTFKTGILLNNPANTFAYTFTPAAIAAARTITLPLLTGNDTMVCEAHTQTLTNKTISGSSNTITNVAISTAVSGLGAGVAAFLGTPSSANLRTALTDETGTGSAVFATSPTLTTPVFSSIVNTGTLTLPTSTDTLVGRATTDTLTNKTIAAGSNTITGIADANVAAGAAIAGTKISPDFGSQLIQTSGNALATNILATGYFHTSGSPTPTSGQIRLENTHKIATRNAGNTANICIASGSVGDVVFYGLNPSYTEQAYGVIAGATGYVWLAVNSAFYIKLESSEVRTINPVVGDVDGYASPYGCHGAVVSAMTDANYTVPPAEYKYFTISFETVCTAGRTITFPHPSSLARSYIKNIQNISEQTLTISTGTGTTVTIATGKRRFFEFTNGGVRTAGAEY